MKYTNSKFTQSVSRMVQGFDIFNKFLDIKRATVLK